MTTQEMLASLEAHIRKDIPRLMELREGCILVKRDTKYNPAYRKIVFTYNNVYYIPSQCFGLKVIEFSKENIDKDYEIIGHDIMLNDVLEWIFTNKIQPHNVLIFWDFSKPLLKDQSEQLIKFLYNHIK